MNKERVGVYLGITEHGNVETENEIFEISQFEYDTKVWSHHHNPRTVANNPAGEVTLSLKITGPHYTLGAACAAGNAGLIQGCQMLRLGEVDMALCGGRQRIDSHLRDLRLLRRPGGVGLLRRRQPRGGLPTVRPRPQRHRRRGGRRDRDARTARLRQEDAGRRSTGRSSATR